MSRRPQGERDEVLAKLRRLLRKPRTMADLVSALEVEERTVYRYLEALTDDGVQVVRLGVGRPVKYQVS